MDDPELERSGIAGASIGTTALGLPLAQRATWVPGQRSGWVPTC
jgi:hypothetical protein